MEVESWICVLLFVRIQLGNQRGLAWSWNWRKLKVEFLSKVRIPCISEVYVLKWFKFSGLWFKFDKVLNHKVIYGFDRVFDLLVVVSEFPYFLFGVLS